MADPNSFITFVVLLFGLPVFLLPDKWESHVTRPEKVYTKKCKNGQEQEKNHSEKREAFYGNRATCHYLGDAQKQLDILLLSCFDQRVFIHFCSFFFHSKTILFESRG